MTGNVNMNTKIAKLTCYKGFFKIGRIVTKVGYPVPLLPDMAAALCRPEKLKVIAKVTAEIVKRWKAEVIASPELRGVPYGTAVSLFTNLPFLMLRKKVKQYQLGRLIEGDYKKGERVVIIDDAISSSRTKIENIKVLRKHGLRVVGVIVFVNAWGGYVFSKTRAVKQTWFKRYGVKFAYLVNWSDCVKMWMKKGLMKKELGDLVLKMIKNPLRWGKRGENWQKFKELAKDEKNLVFHESFYKI